MNGQMGVQPSPKGKGLLQISVLESATVKNACYRTVLSNRKVIGNANDVHKFCQAILKWKQVIMNKTQCTEENLYSLKM